MNTNKTALILVDPQNDFLSKQGKLYSAVETGLTRNDVINKLNRLLAASHKANMTVIHTPIVFDKESLVSTEELYGIMAPVAESGGFIRGTNGAEVAAGVLEMADTDIIIEKNHICAFEETNLDQVLKEKGITTVILCGLLTDVCLEATMRIAYDKGFEVFTVTDASATLDVKKHASTIETSFPLFSKPVNTELALTMIDA